jgi:hypothetical protein
MQKGQKTAENDFFTSQTYSKLDLKRGETGTFYNGEM